MFYVSCLFFFFMWGLTYLYPSLNITSSDGAVSVLGSGLSFSLDTMFLLVIFMLLNCFFFLFFYTSHYFRGSEDGLFLNRLVFLFVSVMGTLMFSSGYFTTLVFWEYLGVVSFFLILFYSNYLSIRAGLITMVSSRFGDVCLFFIVALGGVYTNYFSLTFVALLFVVLSKSAAYPFISWLLEAMRAPTPVSSLVHSATLVAAGVWFSLRYDIFNDSNCVLFFTCFLLLSILISAISASFFFDLKKIVALSTCNNISWCVLYLIYGDVYLCLAQLVTHGMAKCGLFMSVGDLMSGTYGSQSGNFVYLSRFFGSMGLFIVNFLILALSGVPFLGVFFSKHFFLSSVGGIYNLGFVILLYVCVCLSYFYSFRFCAVVSQGISGNSSGECVNYSFVWLLCLVSLLFNLFFCYSIEEIFLCGYYLACLLAFIQFFCLPAAALLYFINFSPSGVEYLFGSDGLIGTFYYLYGLIDGVYGVFLFRWDQCSVSVGSSFNLDYLASVFNLLIFFFSLFLVFSFLVLS